MGLYRVQTEEELYIEESCEKCLDTFINTGDASLAESYVFDDIYYSLCEEAETSKSLNDMSDDEKSNFESKVVKSYQQYWKNVEEKRKKFEKEHPNLYKIGKTANEYREKLVHFLSEKKNWFIEKLDQISKWADECEDNNKKAALTRIIAFIVRVIKKIANKIADLVDRMKG